jgi:hypothetical protein
MMEEKKIIAKINEIWRQLTNEKETEVARLLVLITKLRTLFFILERKELISNLPEPPRALKEQVKKEVKEEVKKEVAQLKAYKG